jgi:hypothetical protein
MIVGLQLLVVLLAFTCRSSCLGLFLMYLVPVLGLFSIAFWFRQITSNEFSPSLFYALFQLPVFYAFLSVSYAAAYRAASNSWGAVTNGTVAARTLPEFLYFSVVTASTLGYGDYVPKGQAQLLACVQVIEFWLFFIVVASGVAKNVVQPRSERRLIP